MITENDIRMFFRDYPKDNMKHLAEFFLKEEIDFAIRLARDQVDKMPPIVQGINSSSIPDYIMLDAVAVRLITVKLNNLAINQTSGVTEHGVQLGIGEEYGALKDRQSDLEKSFINNLYQYKKAMDFRNSLGSMTSPYGKMRGARGRGSINNGGIDG